MITSDAQIKNIDVSNLKGVGPKISSSLNRLKIFSLFDLIFHFPFRYQDRTFISKVSDLTTDSKTVLLCLKVKAVEGFVGSRGKVLKILFADDTGVIEASFFNTYATFVHNFTSGRRVLAYGSIKPDYMTGRPSLVHPEITFLQTDEEIVTEEFLTPIYPSTEGLGQAILRKTIKTALDLIHKAPLPEILPKNLNPYGISLNDAINDVHYPHPQSDHAPLLPQNLTAFERICYEELIAYQLCLLLLKVSNSSHKAALSITFNAELSDNFLKSLSFKPTSAQLRVFNEILDDLKLNFLENEFHLRNISLETKVDDKIVKLLRSFIIDNKNKIKENSKMYSEAAKFYYKQRVGNSKKIGIVDLGWRGSGAISLKDLFENYWNFDCEVKSLIAFGMSRKNGFDDGFTLTRETNTFAFSEYVNYDYSKKFQSSLLINMSLIEILKMIKAVLSGKAKFYIIYKIC